MPSYKTVTIARVLLTRVILFLIIVTSAMLATSAPAQAVNVPREYAGIVVDAKTGETLYAHAADSLRYPASVTKVMTLYVVFQELEAGNMTLSTRMTVSRHAANAQPTKLGLRPGATISVEDAIKSLVTKSANDISRVIAEHISGTESAFAERMTRTAEALGMNRTVYKNASGLPDSGQVTTVRDQARLGVAIFQHFPDYYDFFSLRSFRYNGTTMGNHNRLLGENGVDGLKTGYTRASGFNLLTSARHNDHHIVVAAFGFSTSSARDSKVRELVDRYNDSGRRGTYLASALIPVPSAAVAYANWVNDPVTPMPRIYRGLGDHFLDAPLPLDPQGDAALAAVQTASLDSTPAIAPVVPEEPPLSLLPVEDPISTANVVTPASDVMPPQPQPLALAPPQPEPNRPRDVIGEWLNEAISFGPDTRLGAGSGGLQSPGGPLPPAPITGSGGQAIDLMTSGSVGNAAGDETGGPWVVQVGAVATPDAAQALLWQATGKVAVLVDFRSYIERIEQSGQSLFRARFAGFAGRDQAQAACNQLTQQGMSCLAMPGQG